MVNVRRNYGFFNFSSSLKLLMQLTCKYRALRFFNSPKSELSADNRLCDRSTHIRLSNEFGNMGEINLMKSQISVSLLYRSSRDVVMEVTVFFTFFYFFYFSLIVFFCWFSKQLLSLVYMVLTICSFSSTNSGLYFSASPSNFLMLPPFVEVAVGGLS